MSFRRIFVVGAKGLVGRQVLALLPGARALARDDGFHFEGADVVVNCAGPLAGSAADVLDRAVAAGAAYVDVGGEQHVLRELYERHDATARRAGKLCVPGMGVDCAIGDLAVARAAGTWDRVDDVAVSYVYDELVVSAGSQRSLFGNAFARPLAWIRDRWEPATPGGRRVNAGSASGGERDTVPFAGGDAITIPKHLDAGRVGSYISTTRSAAASRAIGLVARALPFIPKAAGQLLVPYAPADADHGATRFAVIAEVRRGFSDARVVVRGRDPYRTTAAIAAWAAAKIARGETTGAVGMRSPAEAFGDALGAMARACDLTIDA